jgi:colanic acid/amylovoran biosynthesis protein
MTEKILLINVHSDENAGDAILTKIAVEQLEQAFPGCDITIVMNDPTSHQGREKVIGSSQTWIKETFPDRPARWRTGSLIWLVIISILIGISIRFFKRPSIWLAPRRWRALFQAYLECDLVVSNPGGFFYSSGKLGISLLYNVYTLALARLMNKPFYLLPQSIGPFNNKKDEFLIRMILKHARIIMVREPVSLEKLRNTGLKHPRLLLIPDIALTFRGEGAQSALEWLEKKGLKQDEPKPRLGITAINWEVENIRFHNQKCYEEALEAAARFFIEKTNGEVFLFTQVLGPTLGQDDRIPARRLHGMLSDHKKFVHLIDESLSPSLKLSLYGEMDIFIGTRLHSAIFALSGGTPVLAIGYQYKTSGIYQMLGMEKWNIAIEDVNSDRLTQLLADLWEERANVSRQIRKTYPELAAQASQAGRLICEDFKQLSIKNGL